MKFKFQSNCFSIKLCVETASADFAEATAFPKEYHVYMQQINYSPDLIFNVDMTGLYWKKLLAQTFISREERSTSGFKVTKDRLTFSWETKFSETLQLKSVLMYHSQIPRALKGSNIDMLPVY